MLQAKDRGMIEQWSARVAGTLLMALVSVAALGVSALRGPTSKANAEEPVHKGQNTRDVFFIGSPWFIDACSAQPVPFDLSYIVPDAQGIFAFRPAVIFGREDMKEHAKAANAALELLPKEFELKAGLGLPVEAIEQVTGKIDLLTDKQGKDPQTALAALPTLVRATNDFDWKEHLKNMRPDVVEVPFEGKVYYKFPNGFPPLYGKDLCFTVPDSRTVVFEEEKNLRLLLSSANQPQPQPAWAEDWKRINRSLIAVAVSTSNDRWFRDRKPSEGAKDRVLATILAKVNSLAISVEYTDGFKLQAFTRCKSDEAGVEIVAMAKGVLALICKDIDDAATTLSQGQSPSAPSTDFEPIKGILKQSRIERQGTLIIWRSEAKGGFAEVIAALLGADPAP